MLRGSGRTESPQCRVRLNFPIGDQEYSGISVALAAIVDSSNVTQLVAKGAVPDSSQIGTREVELLGQIFGDDDLAPGEIRPSDKVFWQRTLNDSVSENLEHSNQGLNWAAGNRLPGPIRPSLEKLSSVPGVELTFRSHLS